MRNSVSVIGIGLMGCGIAVCSLLAGRHTILYDIDSEKAKAAGSKIRAQIDELLNNDLCTAAQADAAMDLISYSDDLKAACDQSALVIEAIFENLEAKQNLFETIDGYLPPEIPILSNTSGLRITDISAKTKHPERTVTAHFWLPAHLIPLVEVVMGDKTDEKVAVAVKELLTTWGKAPVLVKRDLPGQLANRILQAIIRESVNIVEMGLATPEDVDTAIKMGMALRFPVWGPLEHIESVGLDLGLSVQRTVLPEISGSKTPSPYLEKLVADGHLGYKTGSGFYDWHVRDMNELMKKRNEFIIYALKKVR